MSQYLAGLYKYALKTDIDGQLYLDCNRPTYDRLIALSAGDNHLQTSIAQQVVVRREYEERYLVPVEAIVEAIQGEMGGHEQRASF